MAHESFEDPAISAVMNDLMINIKVDREERPDMDARVSATFETPSPQHSLVTRNAIKKMSIPSRKAWHKSPNPRQELAFLLKLQSRSHAVC
jgi:hypothetical protein